MSIETQGIPISGFGGDHRPRAGCAFFLKQRAAGDTQDLFEMFSQPLCRTAKIAEFGAVDDLETWFRSQGTGNVELVVTADGSAVAFGGLFPGRGNQSHVGSLCLFVHDHYHRLGIGSVLLAALIKAGQDVIGLRRIQLLVYSDNERAISLYRRFGFMIEGHHVDYVRRGDQFMSVCTMSKMSFAFQSKH
jgi:putative acetyltransferase